MAKQEPKVEQNPILLFFVKLQNSLNESLSTGIENFKQEKSSLLFFTLCLMAFLYGIIHVIGPGHGKGILINWILNSPQKIKPILVTSISAAILHALSSVIIIVITYLILNRFFSIESEKIHAYLNIPAGIILMVVGIYFIIHVVLMIKKKKLQKQDEANPIVPTLIRPVWIILSIGIVPCPISTLIMIFTLAHGLLWQGVIFVLFFAAGMGLSLLAIGLGVYYLREKILKPRFQKLQIVFYLVLPLLASIVFIATGIGMVGVGNK